jgi:hypothetical protein
MRHILSHFLLLVGLAVCALAQRSFYVVDSDDSTWNQQDWTLSTTEYIPAQYQTRMSLANG